MFTTHRVLRSQRRKMGITYATHVTKKTMCFPGTTKMALWQLQHLGCNIYIYIYIYIYIFRIFVADMGEKKNSFKAVSHNHLLTISVNKKIFFGSEMSQTKYKPLRRKIFLGSLWQIVVDIWNIFFFKIITGDRKLLCISNIQILKSLNLRLSYKLLQNQSYFFASL